MFDEDEEFDEMEDVLIFDEDAEKVWGDIFDISTPEEVSKAMGKSVLVKSKGKVYKNGNNV